jgi:hypothetical protein
MPLLYEDTGCPKGSAAAAQFEWDIRQEGPQYCSFGEPTLTRAEQANFKLKGHLFIMAVLLGIFLY